MSARNARIRDESPRTWGLIWPAAERPMICRCRSSPPEDLAEHVEPARRHASVEELDELLTRPRWSSVYPTQGATLSDLARAVAPR